MAMRRRWPPDSLTLRSPTSVLGILFAHRDRLRAHHERVRVRLLCGRDHLLDGRVRPAVEKACSCGLERWNKDVSCVTMP